MLKGPSDLASTPADAQRTLTSCKRTRRCEKNLQILSDGRELGGTQDSPGQPRTAQDKPGLPRTAQDYYYYYYCSYFH